MMLTRMKKKIRGVWNQRRRKQSYKEGRGKYWMFQGNEKNYIRNGACVLEESVSLFHGKVNPIRCFSVSDLNNMNVERLPVCVYAEFKFFHGSWEERDVLVKIFKGFRDEDQLLCFLREIVITSQMATHNNAHKILGCCLETECPTIVYEWVAAETLLDRIIPKEDDDNKRVLEWKDRLRIAWEISHAVAYLHTAFPRPIVHRELKPDNVMLDQNNRAKLSDFSLCISIPINPDGENFVEDVVAGTYGYVAPDYMATGVVAESTNVFSFGMLLLELLTGKRAVFMGGESDWGLDLLCWVRDCIKNERVKDIVDLAITRTGLTTIEDLQVRASIYLALDCCTFQRAYRPTMKEVAIELKNLITYPESIPPITRFQYWIFRGSKENFVQNQAFLRKESLSFFYGRLNPIHYFSVDDLNNMNVERVPVSSSKEDYYQGSWEGKAVMIKRSCILKYLLREIVLATQMAHDNVPKLLGCCLETKTPVLVYEWVTAETLADRIFVVDADEDQKKLPVLEWKDRLRIALEISHVVSYLHTGFPWPIICNLLEPVNVFLTEDGVVKMCNFSFTMSIPLGEEFVVKRDSELMNTMDYLPPEYYKDQKVGKCTDVYSFGILFVMLLTGKRVGHHGFYDSIRRLEEQYKWTRFVREAMACMSVILDPAITRNGVTTIEDLQLRASMELALKCVSDEIHNRPTMVEVKNELTNMIASPESISTTSTSSV